MAACCFLILRLPPGATLTDTPFPSTTLFRTVHLGRGGNFIAPFQRHVVVAVVAAVAPLLPVHARVKQGRAQAVFHLGAQEGGVLRIGAAVRSEEHTSELQSLMRTSYAVF